MSNKLSSPTDLKNFCKELKDLLNKYNVGIGGSFDGDTHGIYDEKFVVYSLDRGSSTVEYKLNDDYSTYLIASDL